MYMAQTEGMILSPCLRLRLRFALKLMNFVILNDGFCATFDEFHFQNDDFNTSFKEDSTLSLVEIVPSGGAFYI